MADSPIDQLDHFRQDAALSHGELWLRYFELGGMSTGLQLEAYLYGALEPSRHDRDVIAHALNERFVELGGNHPVPYMEDGSGGDHFRRREDREDRDDREPDPPLPDPV
jgi:hypothetical protein